MTRVGLVRGGRGLRSLAIVLLLLAAACSSSSATPSPGADRAPPRPKESARQPATDPPAVVLSPPGADPVRVQVEVARSAAERQRGLMYRQSLAPQAGMLFLFERAHQLSFWMRNTYIPLDMIFIEPSMRVLGVVEHAEPMTDVPRRVQGISQFVLEVNAGFSRAHGIGPGTKVRFQGVPKN